MPENTTKKKKMMMMMMKKKEKKKKKKKVKGTNELTLWPVDSGGPPAQECRLFPRAFPPLEGDREREREREIKTKRPENNVPQVIFPLVGPWCSRSSRPPETPLIRLFPRPKTQEKKKKKEEK